MIRSIIVIILLLLTLIELHALRVDINHSCDVTWEADDV